MEQQCECKCCCKAERKIRKLEVWLEESKADREKQSEIHHDKLHKMTVYAADCKRGRAAAQAALGEIGQSIVELQGRIASDQLSGIQYHPTTLSYITRLKALSDRYATALSGQPANAPCYDCETSVDPLLQCLGSDGKIRCPVCADDHKGQPAADAEVEKFRQKIEKDYEAYPTGTGGSFGEILCHEIHEEGLTFKWLAEKWGISVTFLGELIADHCIKLEPIPGQSEGGS